MFYLSSLSRSSLGPPASALCRPLVAAFAAILGAFSSLPTAALTEDADQPIQIFSDELVYEEKAEKATYRGAVRVNQGSLKITAEEVTIEFENDKVVRLIAQGNPAYYSQKLKSNQETMQADARTIVYHTRDEKVDLEGNAHLTQQGNDFRGELIEYDIRAGRVDAASAEPKRIQMTLQPKRSKAPATQTDNAADAAAIVEDDQ